MTAHHTNADFEYLQERVDRLETVLRDLTRDSQDYEPLYPLDVKKAVIDAGIMDKYRGVKP